MELARAYRKEINGTRAGFVQLAVKYFSPGALCQTINSFSVTNLAAPFSFTCYVYSYFVFCSMWLQGKFLKNTFLHFCVYLNWSKIGRKILEIVAWRQALSGYAFLQGSSLMFKLHTRLRLVCRTLPAAVGEARKELWRSLVHLILGTSELTKLHICVYL